jgi:hypothetical protein
MLIHFQRFNLVGFADSIGKITYVIVGSGEPPVLLHVNSCFFSSVAVTMEPGATRGGCGGVRTVRL